MSAWIVYSKDGLTERCELHAVEYGGTHMGERAVTATFESDSKVDFDIFDYLSYRGEVFELESVPTVKKTSSFEYSYELRFVSRKYELERCEMRDLVPSDNGVVYPTPLSFSFTGDVRYLTDRIQACLDDLYGEGVWDIVIADGVDSEEKNITIAQQNCWNALALVNSTYGLDFYIKGRVITIGGSQPVVSHVFEYGKGNGLYEIERAANTDTAIVTKLRAYGSDRNLDYSYPKKPEWSDSNLPVSFAFSPLRLMLPSFKVDKTDYVLADEETIKKYGIREASIVYEDIYPSITGATHNGRAIDEIKAVEAVDDNASSFVVYLHDLGFDLEEHLTTTDAQISMKSGAMQGYTFTISNIEKQEDNSYKITLGRVSAEGGENYNIPNSDWNMREGDKFVLLNILMPQKYIREAENRLKQRAEEYLAQYSKTNFGYNIGLHDKFLIENPSVYDALIEGSKLSVYDEELGISEDVTIQSITITENAADNTIPQVKVTLNNEPSASTLDRIQGKIDSLANESAANNFATQSEIMAQYRKKLDKPFFDKLFAAVDAEGNEIPSTDTVTPVAYIKARYDFAVVGGVTMYLNDGSLDLPSIFEGIPVDNDTIYWEETKDEEGNVITRVLKSRGVGEGGVTPTLLGDLKNVGSWANAIATEDRIMVQKKDSSFWEALELSKIGGSVSFENVKESGEGNVFTSFILSDDKKTLTFLKDKTFAEKSSTLSGYGITDAYTKTEADNLLAKKWTQDDAKITNWDTAFGWGDHSAAGYATQATTLAGYGITNAYTKAEVNILLGEKADWGSSLSDYGITNAYTSTEVDSLLEKYLPIIGGTITGNLRLRTGTEYTSPYLYFGDGSEVWIKEVSDTYLTVHADGGVRIDSPATFIDGIKIEKSADGVLYIDADLVVKGGVTMFANEGSYTPSTITDAVSVDNQTIIKQGGKLMVNPELVFGSGGGGEVSTVSWGNIIGKPTWITDTKPVYKYAEISGTPDLSVYAPIESLDNYQSKITTTNKLSYSLIDGTPNLSVYALKSDLNGYQIKITESSKLSYSLIDDTPDLDVYATKGTSLSHYGITDAYTKTNVNSLLSAKWTKDDTKISNWDTAYSWGNHAQAGYFKSADFTKNKIKTTLGVSDWALASTKPSYTTKEVAEDTNLYFTNARAVSALTETLKGYVTLSGTQTISGEKNFTGGLKVNGSPIVYNATGKYWKLEGDLLVTGGITMFGNDSAFSPSTITQAVNIDGSTLVRKNGVIMLNPDIEFGGGVADSVAWDNIDGKPSWITKSKPEYKYSEIKETPDLSGYAKKATTLSGYGITDATMKISYDFRNGNLVRLDVGASVNAMITVIIRGNSYTHSSLGGKCINTCVEFYNYNTDNLIYNANATHFGLDFGDISIFNYDGYICLWFAGSDTYRTYSVEAFYTNSGGIQSNKVKSITDSAMPTSGVTRLVTITPIKGVDTGMYTASDVLSKLLTKDGTGSKLDADLLDGQEGSYYASAASLDNYLPKSSYTANDVLAKLKTVDGAWSGLDADTLDGLHASSLMTFTDHPNYVGARFSSDELSKKAAEKYIEFWGSGGWFNGTWGKLSAVNGFVGNLTGNAATATKLQTARTLWGNSFNGSSDIKNADITLYQNESSYTGGWARAILSRDSSGTILSEVGFYGASDSLTYTYIGGRYIAPRIVILANGKVGVGTTSPQYDFDVNGSTRIQGTSVVRTVKPESTNSYSLGDSSYLWSNVYTKKANIDGIEIKKSADGVLYIGGNLVVSGGVTMYGTDGTAAPTIWDGAPKATTFNTTNGKGIASFDSKFFSVSNGHVTFIGQTGGGVADSVAWGNVTGKPTWIGSNKPSYTTSEVTEGTNLYFTNARAVSALSSTLSNYLTLSGGTINGMVTIKPTNVAGVQDGIVLHDGGYGSGESLKIKWTSESYKTGLSLLVQQNNESLLFENSKGYHTIWHSGNDGASSGLDADKLDGQEGSYYASASSLANYLPLSGGTLTDKLTGTTIVANDLCWREYKNKTLSSGGWYRFATSTRPDSYGNTYILSICRVYNSTSNESYLIAVTLDYSGCSFTQLVGHRYSAAVQLVTKIRCTRTHSGDVYFDFYYTGSSQNTVSVNAIGHCKVQTPEATSSTLTYTDEFSLEEGVKSSLGFIGDLKGNADTATSASKLSTVSKTAWGQTYWTSGGVPTDISGNMSGVGNITPKTNNTYNIGDFGNYFKTGVFNTLNCGATSNNLWLCGGNVNGQGVVIARASSLSSATEVCRFTEKGMVWASGVIPVIASNAQEIHLKYNNSDSTSIVLNSTSFKPFINASNNLMLGRYDSLWKGLFLSTDDSVPRTEKGVTFCSSNGYAEGKIGANSRGIGIYTVGGLYLRGGCTKGANGTMKESSTGAVIDASGNMLVTGGVTMYSDLRKKTILNHVELSLKEVADAPLIEHYYNSDESKRTHVGSVAQYWAGLNDWFCKEDEEGFLTMEIQNAALASAISVARELTRYESKTDKQIKKLKKRIGELEEEIENLKNK